MEGHLKFLGGGGLKVKILEAKYEAKLEFPGGKGGVKQKNLPWGEYRYLLKLHNLFALCNQDLTCCLLVIFKP